MVTWVTETFKVTFQQLYSTIYNQQSVFHMPDRNSLNSSANIQFPSTLNFSSGFNTYSCHSQCFHFKKNVLHWIISMESF